MKHTWKITPKTRRRAILIALALQALVTFGCVGFSITNNSMDHTARTLVKINGYVDSLSITPPGVVRFVQSEHEGQYYVKMLDNDQTVADLKALRTQLVTKMFSDLSLSEAELDALYDQINGINARLAAMGAPDEVSCEGSVDSFGMVTIILNWSESAGTWSMTCTTESMEE